MCVCGRRLDGCAVVGLQHLGLTITKTQTGFKLSASKYIDMLRARFFPSGVTHAGYM